MLLIYLILSLGFKHLVADHYLQPSWMSIGKRLEYPYYVYPLLLHASIHFICMVWFVLLTGLFVPVTFTSLVIISLSDFVSHTIIDRLKVLYWDSKRGMYLDQALHGLFYLGVMIYIYSLTTH